MRELVLASTSCYRRELLERLGMPFSVEAPDIDEAPLLNEPTAATARRLALGKALKIAAQKPQAVVIGSDQVADLHGQIVGKPGSHEAATTQLKAMQGQAVVFHTAVAVVCMATGFEAVEVVTVRAQFRSLSDTNIELYLKIERPYDCAGSAKVEGLGIVLMERVESDDPTALIGLPLIQTCKLLRLAGIDPLELAHTARGRE